MDSPTCFIAFFFSLCESFWALDKWVKIFSILDKISRIYFNFRFKKMTPRGYDTPGRLKNSNNLANQNRKYINPRVNGSGRFELGKSWRSKISLDCPLNDIANKRDRVTRFLKLVFFRDPWNIRLN